MSGLLSDRLRVGRGFAAVTLRNSSRETQDYIRDLQEKVERLQAQVNAARPIILLAPSGGLASDGDAPCTWCGGREAHTDNCAVKAWLDADAAPCGVAEGEAQ